MYKSLEDLIVTLPSSLNIIYVWEWSDHLIANNPISLVFFFTEVKVEPVFWFP